MVVDRVPGGAKGSKTASPGVGGHQLACSAELLAWFPSMLHAASAINLRPSTKALIERITGSVGLATAAQDHLNYRYCGARVII